MPEPPHLLVLVGMPVAPKATLAATLAHTLQEAGRTVTLLDNSDRPLRLGFPTVRLPAGCVCCTVAGRLFPAVAQVTTDTALLVVSAQAQPELLARVLDSLRSTTRTITIIALLDQQTYTRFPYLADQYLLMADVVLSEPFDPEALVQQAQVFVDRSLLY
jgi:G3E family GTPase